MKLREYQEEIANTIDKIFKGIDRDERRFVGVKLPTGGGKSFLFLDQFEKFIELYQDEPKDYLDDKNSCISDISVKYFAPLKGILTQTQVNTAKHVLYDFYIKSYKEKNGLDELKIDDVPKVIKQILERFESCSELTEEQKERINNYISTELNENNLPEEKVRNIYLELLFEESDNIEKIIKKEFPNLDFICYQKNKNETIDLDNVKDDVKLVVFDEAHRNKLYKKDKIPWGQKALELIKRLKKTKFLAITATPERDADGAEPLKAFADESGYTVRELRIKDYLASDMPLVTALERKLVVKPQVVNFDCMLDKTKEYLEIEQKLINALNNSSTANNLSVKKDEKTGELVPTDGYHILLLNFLQMCKLSGKLEFVQRYVDDELKETIRELVDGTYKTKINDLKYHRKLEKIVRQVEIIDDENSDLHIVYEKERLEKILEMVSKTIDNNQFLNHCKHICFVPSSPSKDKTKQIMFEYKEIMMQLLGLESDDVMITHSNKDVIYQDEDTKNLKRFSLSNVQNGSKVMVAMDKFNEGLHISRVKSLFMFRQFIDKAPSDKEDEKEEPAIIFLQQVGRCITSITPGEEVKEPPVIFDFACNFMRYNEKLKNIFEISENQSEFIKIYKHCKEFGKLRNSGRKKDDTRKENILERIIGVMRVLNENNIDISNITKVTNWEEIESIIPDYKKEEVLDEIFMVIGKNIKSNYPIGARIVSSREAFWHIEKENPKSGEVKKAYNTSTDEFFSKISFKDLYESGFFTDIQNKTNEKVNEDGFIIGECANFQGLNVRTGTEYTKLDKDNRKLPTDISGFSRNKKINSETLLRYDRHFFRYIESKKTWINLWTGKDEDVLGFNHEGIRVNPEKGRVGFDRQRRYHKKLENGSYSKQSSLYDEEGYDAYGFDSFNNQKNGRKFDENGFYRIRGRKGFVYLNENQKYEYDIDGFNEQGFNKDGIHKVTGCKYNESGICFKVNSKTRNCY